MKLEKQNPLPSEDHVMRYVSPARLRKDEDNNIIGILGEAFKQRKDEEGLSVTWVEYFTGTHNQQIESAVRKLRSCMPVKPASGFAIGKVDRIISTCNIKNNSRKTRIIYMPTANNKAHAEVRSIPSDDSDLLEILAAETWSELILNANIAD